MKAPLALLTAASALAMAGNSPASGQTRFSTIYNFSDGYPRAISRVGAVLYGAFQGKVNGSYTCGSIFSLEPVSGGSSGQWNESVLYSFGANLNACTPTIAPLPGPNGALYGLAGVLYELLPPAEPGGAWTETDLCNLTPTTGLASGPAGSFYVLDEAADLLQLSPPAAGDGPWTATDLFDFPSGPVLAPNSLIAGPDGILYGTAGMGGYARANLGAAFQLTPPTETGGSWHLKILHNFGAGGGTGGNPVALTLAPDGTLYGVTCGAGANCNPVENGNAGAGVVFQLTPPASEDGEWAYTVLANFHTNNPYSPLVLRGGNLYGTYETATGGVVFELQPPATPGNAWTIKYLHHFTNGQVPFGPIILDENGVLYGTTGTLNNFVQTGTVYRIETQ